MDWGTVGQWAGVLSAVAIALWGATSKRNDRAIEELKGDRTRLFERVDGIDREIATVKADVRHLPTREEMHSLALQITRVDGKLDAVLDKINALVAQNTRAEERAFEAERRAEEAERRER